MDDIDPELQNWKNKYFDALGELEAKEKAWARNESVLRQGLSRLTLAADSADEALNRQMEQLRAMIRSGKDGDELKRLLDSISEAILRLDQARQAQQKIPAPHELLEELIGRIEFPRGMGHRAKALQKKLLQASDKEYQQLGEEFVKLITETLQWVAEQAGAEGGAPVETERPGLLGKLFSGRETSEREPAADTLQPARRVLRELVRSLAQPETARASMMARLDDCQREEELLKLGRELADQLRQVAPAPPAEVLEVGHEELPINEVLLRLVERLEVPSELNAQVEEVKALLGQALEAEGLDKALRAIAELVSEMRSRALGEKNEMEAFLQQLTERLQEIDVTFQQNVSNQRDSYAEGRELDEAVNVQMQGIEESVSEAHDLEMLKSTVQQRVDTIRHHMQRFRDAESERLKQMEQQVEQLTGRLHSVQAESDTLRKRLKDERDQAMIDPLTGIPNRLAYNDRLKQEEARWRRYGSALVLMVWDVDRFKLINDTYGHQAGDKVLTVIAKLLHKQVRETDFVARYGGEEFVLLLPETSLENAAIVGEHLRKSVEECEFHFRGSRVPITISCGMSQFGEGDTATKVFARADAALYKAKESGRNQCRSA
jgi:diguanylate cyclase